MAPEESKGTSEARKHRIRAEYRVMRRRLRFSGKSLREYLVQVAGQDPAASTLTPERIGEIVAERLRDEIARMQVNPLQLAREISRVLEPKALPAPSASQTPAQPPPIPVDNIQAMLDRILDRPH